MIFLTQMEKLIFVGNGIISRILVFAIFQQKMNMLFNLILLKKILYLQKIH